MADVYLPVHTSFALMTRPALKVARQLHLGRSALMNGCLQAFKLASIHVQSPIDIQLFTTSWPHIKPHAATDKGFLNFSFSLPGCHLIPMTEHVAQQPASVRNACVKACP